MIRWARTTEVDGEFSTQISKPASWSPGVEGQRQLLIMLSKSSDQLGHVFPKLRKMLHSGETPQKFCCIGEGATSTVYMGKNLEPKKECSRWWGKVSSLLPTTRRRYRTTWKRLAGVPSLLQWTKVENGVLFFLISLCIQFRQVSSQSATLRTCWHEWKKCPPLV